MSTGWLGILEQMPDLADHKWETQIGKATDEGTFKGSNSPVININLLIGYFKCV